MCSFIPKKRSHLEKQLQLVLLPEYVYNNPLSFSMSIYSGPGQIDQLNVDVTGILCLSTSSLGWVAWICAILQFTLQFGREEIVPGTDNHPISQRTNVGVLALAKCIFAYYDFKKWENYLILYDVQLLCLVTMDPFKEPLGRFRVYDFDTDTGYFFKRTWYTLHPQAVCVWKLDERP